MAQTAPSGWFDDHADGSKWGTALHQILQRNPASRAAALRRLYRTGAFSDHLHEGAAASIDQLAQHPILKDINDSGVLIYTERSIISKDATLRPDLVIKAGSSVTVVDYKTGVQKPEHQEQLNRYVELLSTVFEAVDGTLLYL
jgi:ATP-dependent exoDNAse (exonuclease V) beta subunit